MGRFTTRVLRNFALRSFWAGLFFAGAVAHAEPDSPPTTETSTSAAPSLKPVPLQPLDQEGGAGEKVLIIPIHGPIDLGLVPFVERALDTAESERVAAVIVDVNTFGGRVDAAVQIRDLLLSQETPTIAFVNRRAISAGALISLATDQMVFSPGASIGAATPIQIRDGQAEAVGEKMMSYMRAEMRATAEAKGRDPRVAEAMVDKSVVVDGVSTDGKLLTLSTKEAVAIGWANDQQETLGGVLKALGLEDAERIQVTENWAETFVRFITRPEVSGILMSLGLIALAAELYSPGIGLAGGIGVIFLSLFFGGHMAVHLAGWEEVVLAVIGAILLFVEVFVTPGFGVLGTLGVACLASSMVLALIGLPLDVSWQTGIIGEAMTKVLISFAVAIALMVVLFRFLPSRWTSALVLRTAVGDRATDSAAYSERLEREGMVGQVGVAVTDLRPSGKAKIGGKVVEVSSLHDYIDRGESVRVVSASTMSVRVERVEPEPTADASVTESPAE